MPDVEMVPVEASSNVEAVGYADGTLAVRFKSGTAYRYRGVPPELFEALMQAESKGKFIAARVVRGGFAFEKVTVIPEQQEKEPA